MVMGAGIIASWLGQASGTKETASIPWHPDSSPCFQGLAQILYSWVPFLPGTPQPLEFLRTSLGGKFLVYESFLYRKEKAAGEKVYWMCRDQSRLGCRSRAITQGQQVTVMRSHCHLPDLAGLEALRQRERLPTTAQQEDPGTDGLEWAQWEQKGCGDLGLSQSMVQIPWRTGTIWGALCPSLSDFPEFSICPLSWLLLNLNTHPNLSHP